MQAAKRPADHWSQLQCRVIDYSSACNAAEAASCLLLPAVGEDVALALELQCRGHSSCYLHDCLAVGEVPTSIRAICMQKSRSVLLYRCAA
jgi:hypothetical protein